MSDVRLLAPDEMHLMLPGAREFFEEGHLQGTLNEESYVETLASYTRSGYAYVMAKVDDQGILHGAIGAAIAPDFATGELTATEMFFFTLKAYRGTLGIRLLKAFEQEGKRRGARRLFMIHLVKEGSCNLAPFYTRCGYSLVEHVFCKELFHISVARPEFPVRS